MVVCPKCDKPSRLGSRQEIHRRAPARPRPARSASASAATSSDGPERQHDDCTDETDRETATIPRLKQRYRAEIAPALREQFGYANVMQIPRRDKIVVNMGVGDAARDGKLIDGAVRDLTAITGQKPQIARRTQVDRAVQAARGHADRRARHPARRPDVGVPRPAAHDRAARASVTSAACRPRSSTATATTRSGSTSSRCSTRSTRTAIDRPRGMDITVVTTATTDDEGRALLRAARLPVQGGLSHGQEGADRQGEPQAEVRRPRLHPLPALRPSARGLPQVRPVPHLRPRDGPRRRAARRHQVAPGSHLTR